MSSRASSAANRDGTSSRTSKIWPLRIYKTPNGLRWHVYWRRLIVWAGISTIVAWLGLSTGAFFFIKYRGGFTEVRFSHILLLPLKLKEYRHAKGEFWIREGLAAAEQNQWREAFELLRAGLTHVPDHQEARTMVARIYLMLGRPDQAGDVLVAGIPYSKDPLAYVREVVGFLFSVQADQAVIDLCAKLLPNHPKGDPVRSLLVGAKMIAHYNRDQFAEAKALLAAENAENSPQAKLVLARIDWDQGFENYAVETLRALVEQSPADLEAYQVLVSYLRALNRHGEIRRLSLGRQLKFPDHPQAYLDFLQACADEKDVSRQEQAESEFLRLFADNAPALLQLAEYAARTGRPDVAAAVLERCRTLVKEELSATLHLISAHLQARDYPSALGTAEIVLPDARSWNEMQKLYLHGLHIVALAGSGKATEADSMLVPLLESRYLTASIATAIGLRFIELQRPEPALKFLQRAVALDSLYQPAVAHLLRSELRTKDLSELLPLVERFIALRKPAIDLVQELRAKFESDRYLYLPDRADWSARLATPRVR